jgi:hypothetical protein
MPDRWETIPLGTVARFTKGKSPLKRTPPGKFPLVGIAEDWRTAESTQFDGPAICIPMIQSGQTGIAAIQRLHLVSEPFALSNMLTATELHEGSGFAPEFLFLYLNHFRSELLESRMTGTANMSLRISDLEAVPVERPPLPEQHRIVDLMGAVDAYVAAADARVEAARTARTALLTSMLSASDDDWRPFEIRDVARAKGLIGGPFGSSLVTADYKSDGVPVIRGQNLPDSERFVSGEFVFVSRQKADTLARNTALPGDIVATQRGTLGQVAIIPEGAFDKYIISQSQMRLRVDASIADRDFVFLWLDSKRTRRDIDARKSVTANPHINLGIFGALRGMLPPLDTQKEIVRTVAPLDESVRRSVDVAARAKDVRSALLTDLLSGTHELPASYDRFLEAA